METASESFGTWNQYMYTGAAAAVLVGFLIFVYYELSVLRIKDYKGKYDFVNHHEIKFFWYSLICILIAGAFLINTVASTIVEEAGARWFFVRIFISLSFIVVGYFIFHSLLRIYYPRKLATRLHKLRTTPRISPAGNVMRRLTEEEEDLHMEKSMIEEEEVQVVDYDVWIDEKTGYKKIEKYIMHEQASECAECGYYTMIIQSEEMGKAPTSTDSGYLIEHLECTYCGHKEKREVIVSSLSSNVA